MAEHETLKHFDFNFLKGRAQYWSDFSLKIPLADEEFKRFNLVMNELRKENMNPFVRVK